MRYQERESKRSRKPAAIGGALISATVAQNLRLHMHGGDAESKCSDSQQLQRSGCSSSKRGRPHDHDHRRSYSLLGGRRVGARSAQYRAAGWDMVEAVASVRTVHVGLPGALCAGTPPAPACTTSREHPHAYEGEDGEAVEGSDAMRKPQGLGRSNGTARGTSASAQRSVPPGAGLSRVEGGG